VACFAPHLGVFCIPLDASKVTLYFLLSKGGAFFFSDGGLSVRESIPHSSGSTTLVRPCVLPSEVPTARTFVSPRIDFLFPPSSSKLCFFNRGHASRFFWLVFDGLFFFFFFLWSFFFPPVR